MFDSIVKEGKNYDATGKKFNIFLSVITALYIHFLKNNYILLYLIAYIPAFSPDHLFFKDRGNIFVHIWIPGTQVSA